jgi:hypothetical protein
MDRFNVVISAVIAWLAQAIIAFPKRIASAASLDAALLPTCTILWRQFSNCRTRMAKLPRIIPENMAGRCNVRAFDC